MPDGRDHLPFKRSSVLGSALALSYVSRRHKGAPAAIAKSLADRLSDVLPEGEYTIHVDGPLLDVKGRRGESSAGMPGMRLLEGGTPEEKLSRVYDDVARSLRGMIIGAHQRSSAEIEMGGVMLPGAFFDPHVLVTDAMIEVWWGGLHPDEALVRLRPIPRSEIGL